MGDNEEEYIDIYDAAEKLRSKYKELIEYQASDIGDAERLRKILEFYKLFAKSCYLAEEYLSRSQDYEEQERMETLKTLIPLPDSDHFQKFVKALEDIAYSGPQKLDR